VTVWPTGSGWWRGRATGAPPPTPVVAPGPAPVAHPSVS